MISNVYLSHQQVLESRFNDCYNIILQRYKSGAHYVQVQLLLYKGKDNKEVFNVSTYSDNLFLPKHLSIHTDRSDQSLCRFHCADKDWKHIHP